MREPFDYYSMAVYSMLGEDSLAAGLTREVIAGGTEPDGRERAPMRNADARCPARSRCIPRLLMLR